MLHFPNSDDYFRSGPHKRVEQILSKIGLGYESEYSFSPFTIDIYLSEWHIGIEIDGPYHSLTKDKKRDKDLLEKYGLYLLHLKTKDGQNKEEIEIAILDFIDKHYEDSEQRKKTWLSLLH